MLDEAKNSGGEKGCTEELAEHALAADDDSRCGPLLALVEKKPVDQRTCQKLICKSLHLPEKAI